MASRRSVPHPCHASPLPLALASPIAPSAVCRPQELAAEENPDMLPARRAALLRAATLLRDAFYTLQVGMHRC